MSTTTLRLTPLLRSQLRASLQMTPLRSTQRSLSCQGHAVSRFASTSATSTFTSAAVKIPERASADWGRLVKCRAKQAVIYFSLYATLLGWPFAAKEAIMWSRGL